MPNIQFTALKSNRDGLNLSLALALPDGEPRGLIQFAHGMAEHKERYLPFMEFLAGHGYACVINDLRGHGASVKSAEDLGFFYEDGANALVDDLHQITLWFRAQYPGKKLILFGHSMGALAVRAYRCRYEGDIDALVVCGSPGYNAAVGFGLLLNRVMTLFRGERYVSPLFVKMTTGSYSKAHPSKDTANAWLSTNQDNVERYDRDPLCGFPLKLNGYKALLELMKQAYAAVPAGRPDMPVHFISGEADPCAPDRKGFDDAVQRMRNDGYRRVTAKMYPGMRHEILNHTNRQVVYDDLLALFDAWVG